MSAKTLEILRPHGGTVPILFDTPHSGRNYPADLGTSAQLAVLRREEDAYLDELLAGCTGFGVTLLHALFPRCYLDLNREFDDAQGLPLSVDEDQDLIDSVYSSYHEALAQLRAEILEEHGRLSHINWHSMMSVGNATTPDGDGAIRPDFVVGDLNGQSAQGSFTDLVVGLLESQGYEVSVNEPYVGGRILRDMGDPFFGIDSVQIEMNRDLYLDEPTVEKTDGFPPLRLSLRTFTKELVEALG